MKYVNEFINEFFPLIFPCFFLTFFFFLIHVIAGISFLVIFFLIFKSLYQTFEANIEKKKQQELERAKAKKKKAQSLEDILNQLFPEIFSSKNPGKQSSIDQLIEEYIKLIYLQAAQDRAHQQVKQSKKSKDHYLKVLGLKPGASKDEIKKAFKKAAIKYHPDKSTHPNADIRFKEANEAYRVLMNLS